MYSSEKKSILSEEIQTTIMSLRVIRLNEKRYNELREEIGDNRIREAYEISISDHFYNNIMTKGYLVYNSDILLNISTSTARTIYMLIEKLRFNELSLKIDTLFLIKRIPLKFSKTHISRTIKILETNFSELKEKKLIKDFNFIKESTWEKSEIEIFFDEKIVQDKQERFFGDLNDFKKLSTSLTISNMEHDLVKEHPISKETFEKIYATLPSNAKKLKSMPKTLHEALEKYGEIKVESAVIYMNKQKNITNPRAYFLKTLENNWAQDIVVKEKPMKASEPEPEIKEDFSKEENYYISLSEEEKIKLEADVYAEYIKKCGQETKLQKIDFRVAKMNLIYKHLKKNPSVITDIIEFSKYVDKNLELYKIGLNLSETVIMKIKKEILKELATKLLTNTLTREDINDSISSKINI